MADHRLRELDESLRNTKAAAVAVRRWQFHLALANKFVSVAVAARSLSGRNAVRASVARRVCARLRNRCIAASVSVHAHQNSDSCSGGGAKRARSAAASTSVRRPSSRRSR